jgi:hypothetical protein
MPLNLPTKEQGKSAEGKIGRRDKQEREGRKDEREKTAQKRHAMRRVQKQKGR